MAVSTMVRVGELHEPVKTWLRTLTPECPADDEEVEITFRKKVLPGVDDVWTSAMNQRRIDLIDREFDGGLSITETEELERLTTAMRKHVQRVAPLPMDYVRSLHKQLLEQAVAEQTHGS